MNNIKQVVSYISRDFIIEWKNKSVISSAIVYLFAVVFICLQAFQTLAPDTWNALFWIVTLFTILTITGRSFDQEIGNQFAYHYHLTKPQIVITAKLLLNAFYSIIIVFIAYFIFSLFLGNELTKPFLFLIVILLGGSGIGLSFTLTSALSSRAGGNLVITSILSLPIILPLLMVLIQLTNFCFSQKQISDYIPQFLALGLLNIIIALLSSLLFPYLWRN